MPDRLNARVPSEHLKPGESPITEPEKNTGGDWYPLGPLPGGLVPYLADALGHLAHNETSYAEGARWPT